MVSVMLNAKIEQRLNELGKEGWEMCGCIPGAAFMKRPHVGGPIHTRRVIKGDTCEER